MRHLSTSSPRHGGAASFFHWKRLLRLIQRCSRKILRRIQDHRRLSDQSGSMNFSKQLVMRNARLCLYRFAPRCGPRHLAQDHEVRTTTLQRAIFWLRQIAQKRTNTENDSLWSTLQSVHVDVSNKSDVLLYLMPVALWFCVSLAKWPLPQAAANPSSHSSTRYVPGLRAMCGEACLHAGPTSLQTVSRTTSRRPCRRPFRV